MLDQRFAAEGEPRGAGSAASPVSSPFAVPLFELVVLSLGFGLCRAWVISSLGLAGVYPLFDGGLFQYDQLYLLAGAVATCVVALCAPRLFSSKVGLGRLNAVALALVVVSLLSMAAAQASASRALLVAGFCLAGAASALLQVMWGERFVRHSMRLALLAAPAAAIATSLIMMALPGSMTTGCFYIAPLLSLVLLCANRGEAGSLVLNLLPQPDDAAALEGVSEERGAPVPLGTLVRLMASIAVFSLIGRCLDSFPIGSDEEVPAFIAQNYPFLAILVVGVLFIALVLALGKCFDTLFVYRLSLPLMVAGFVILTLFMDRFTVVSIIVVTVGYEFFDVLFWAVLVGVVRQGGHRPVPVFGWGVAATYVGMAFGIMASRAVVYGGVDITALALVSILVLVVLVVLVLPEGTLSKVGSTGRLKKSHASEDVLERRCAVVARRCELTPRERDVLKLLARGRTLGVVARELSIAEGTARTHMGHIYAKLGVHKQQELIDLVEAADGDED